MTMSVVRKFDDLVCCQDVIQYSLTGEEAAKEFFYVDPDTCRVTIKKKLYPGTTTEYTVSDGHVKLCCQLTHPCQTLLSIDTSMSNSVVS